VTTPVRLSLFAALLAAVFGGAAVVGAAVDPSRTDREAGHAGSRNAGMAEHATEHGGASRPSEATLPGLAVAQDGNRLLLKRNSFDRSDRAQRVEFQVLDADGRAVRDFDVAHEKRMHFIVVRRDFENFQHLHPRLSADGTWTQRVKLPQGGTYRVFADFERDGRQHTLGADLQVAGAFAAQPLPRPQRTVRSDGGLEVTLRADDGGSGGEGRVAFEVRDHGAVVTDRLDPYLGAKGHLVALRQADLAYLHTHPEGDELAFETTYPSVGDYRLFVQFSYEGKVHTAAFTRRASR
jgi:hypothetical protein